MYADICAGSSSDHRRSSGLQANRYQRRHWHGQVTGAGNYAAGTSVRISATPDSESTFDGWTSSDGSNTCANSFAMLATDLTCTATFTAKVPNTYTLTVLKSGTGNGTVSSSGTVFKAGDPVTLTATPAQGSTFDGWSSSPCAASFNMPASNLTCTATFTAVAPTTFTVTATAGQGGAISPASRTVEQGQLTTFTVTPNSGYTVKEVTGCNGSLSGTTYTTGPITAACAVNATFTAKVALQPAPAPSTAGLNETVPLMVTVLADNGQPVANVDVTWSVSPANAAGKLLNAQGQPVSSLTVSSSADGKAIARFATGAEPLAYTISAAVGADRETLASWSVRSAAASKRPPRKWLATSTRDAWRIREPVRRSLTCVIR